MTRRLPRVAPKSTRPRPASPPRTDQRLDGRRDAPKRLAEESGISETRLEQTLSFEGRSSQAHREFPRNSESTVLRSRTPRQRIDSRSSGPSPPWGGLQRQVRGPRVEAEDAQRRHPIAELPVQLPGHEDALRDHDMALAREEAPEVPRPACERPANMLRSLSVDERPTQGSRHTRFAGRRRPPSRSSSRTSHITGSPA